MPSVFFSYSHADEALRDQLEKQLSTLKRQKVIETWHDRRIVSGEDFAAKINDHVEHDEIILLLVSSDFIASEYCYDREMKRAMERHVAGEAVVIPIILRACDWHSTPFGRLLATPPDGKPVMQWTDRDQAFLEVSKAVRAAAERMLSQDQGTSPHLAEVVQLRHPLGQPRSSNLRVAKTFSDRDKDSFRHEGFDYVARFFQNSAQELEKREASLSSSFRRIDALRFSVVIYRDGRALSRCTVFMGGDFGQGINYSSTETNSSNSYNESLIVESDDQALYFRPMGMSLATRDGREQKLSMEGAAELYWSILMEPLQRR